MQRLLTGLLAAAAIAGAAGRPAARGAGAAPESPEEMAAATERWMVEGAGARFPDGMADSASDGDFVFVDEAWPLPFRERVGEAVALRVSPETGCYEFEDADGVVFWTVVPVAPLTWNWISPFRSPLRPDTQEIFSPFRLVREWLLTTPEIRASSRSAETRRAPLRSAPAGPATNLCFTAFSYTETNLFFAAAWPTNAGSPVGGAGPQGGPEGVLPGNVLDLYGKSNLSSRAWTFLSTHPATNPPVSFSVEPAALPWYVEPTQHVHDASCVSLTNVVLSPLDGVTVYTNVVWSCATNRTPVPPGFFRLGTHHDTDGDGLFDAFEELASGTDPLDPDTDGDGVPDGLTRSEWRSHPLWAENGDCTNLVVFLCEPITNGFAALRFDDLCIPLSTNAGPWCLCIPTNAVVDGDGALVAAPDVVAELWYGPPEAVDWTPPGPRWTWDVPSSVAVPIWCDDPLAVFGGRLGGGSCRLARPALRVRSDEPGQEGSADVCVHGTDGLVRFSWSVEPSVCTGLRAHATGALSDAGDGRSFSLDVSDAVPGLSGARAGALSVESEGSPFWGDDVLFGTLSKTVSAHRCEGLADPSFGFCLSCGVAHGGPPDACHHASWCATKTNLLADCDCAEPFVRIGNAGTLRLVGEDRPCCSVHDGFPQFADVLSAPGALHAGVSNGVFLAVEPESRSPMIGGFVARYRIYDGDGGTYRDLSLPFTCADLGIDPDFAEMWIPDDAPPAEYFVTNGTLHLARRAAPYPIRHWNESPSDARLVFSFSSPTNGPTLRETPFGIPHPAFSITNAAPFSALNSDTTVYLDASCSNALATLTLTLSDPAANRTFLAESLSVQAVDTDLGEHWRVRSATDSISWDFTDAPEDVYAYLWRPNADSIFGELITNTQSRTPSLSLDLPPGDYLLDFYFPRVYDGGFSAAWSTNYLHVVHTEVTPSENLRFTNATERACFALTNNNGQVANWTISPVVAGGPMLHASKTGGAGSATHVDNATSVWVQAGTAPGRYTITATHPNCPVSTADATFTVGRVDVESLLFNWDMTGSVRDAINLRWNYTNEINLATGEWTRAGYRAPACYVTNTRPIVRATFSAAPADLPSVTLLAETDAAIGGFAATNVAFAGGAASGIALLTKSATMNCILKESFKLAWKAVVSNETEIVTNTLGKTDGHVFYTILDEPKLPWTDSEIANSNVWVSALDVVMNTNACTGSTSQTNCLASLTMFLFENHGLVYETDNGSSQYFDILVDPTTYDYYVQFQLSEYLAKGKGNYVNCYDQAYGLSILGRALGISSEVKFLLPFGYINPTNLIGVGECNSPFFTTNNHVIASSKLRPVDDLDRKWFYNHRYVVASGKVFDCCAGPALGDLSQADYLDAWVDKSTPDEEDLTKFQHVPGVMGKKAGDEGNVKTDAFPIKLE